MAAAVENVEARVGKLEVLMMVADKAGQELSLRTSTLERMMKEVKEYKDDLEMRLKTGSENIVTEDGLREVKNELTKVVMQQIASWMQMWNTLDARVKAVEANNVGQSFGGGKDKCGLVEAKHMVPEVFDGKDEGWNQWKESVEEYVKMKERERSMVENGFSEEHGGGSGRNA